jgi:hypothetical protein
MSAVQINNSNSEDLQYLVDLISEGMAAGENRLTPIISNSFRIDEIFSEDAELLSMLKEERVPTFYDEMNTIDHQLAKKWASKVEYPMSDGHSWARVAQYLQVDPKKMLASEYVRFLNGRLLAMGRNKKGYEEKAEQLEAWLKDLRFSEIAAHLDCPTTFPRNREDPLLLLAKMPFQVYITTSYSDFLERALLKAGKTPRRQICYYNGPTTKDNISNYLPDNSYIPDYNNPVVYYLFGMEEYKSSMVLSEDDYLDFLIRAETFQASSDYPYHLRLALSSSSLLLLGYSLRDWDFRTLFRLILEPRLQPQPSIAIQFKPSLGQKDDRARTENYLNQYFQKQKFDIRWSNAEDFVYDLWDTCVENNIVQK